MMMASLDAWMLKQNIAMGLIAKCANQQISLLQQLDTGTALARGMGIVSGRDRAPQIRTDAVP